MFKNAQKTILFALVIATTLSSIAVARTLPTRLEFSKPTINVDYASRKKTALPKTTWYLFDRISIVSGVTSAVTSDVTSVVTSDVTSPAGTSRVASAVTSPVTSAVTSHVAPKITPKVDKKSLETLTSKTLENISAEFAKENSKFLMEQSEVELKLNPKKFELSNKEKLVITELYQKQNPKEFYFIENPFFKEGMTEITPLEKYIDLKTVKYIMYK